MAMVFAASFGPDPLFKVLFPFMAEHPDGLARSASETFWLGWFDYRMVHVVSYELSDDGDDERSALLSRDTKGGKREVITGLAQWERLGKGWEHVYGIWGWWDPRKTLTSQLRDHLPRLTLFSICPGLLIKPVLTKIFAIRRWISPNRAEQQPSKADPDPLTIRNFIDRIAPFSTHLFDAPHREVRWGLEIMAVAPGCQGKGIGKKIVHEGFSRARQDPEGDLPVVVVAAHGKEGFYQNCGFGDVEGWTSTLGGMENPLYRVGIRGGGVLWTK